MWAFLSKILITTRITCWICIHQSFRLRRWDLDPQMNLFSSYGRICHVLHCSATHQEIYHTSCIWTRIETILVCWKAGSLKLSPRWKFLIRTLSISKLTLKLFLQLSPLNYLAFFIYNCPEIDWCELSSSWHDSNTCEHTWIVLYVPSTLR